MYISGSYIYIEASQRKPGERARLLSSWMEPNETICLQFWYHMHGSDIGNLSVYLKTNQSESLVWRLSGENGNRWRFGQTALYSPNYYKVSYSKLQIQSPLVATATRDISYISPPEGELRDSVR